MKQIRFMEWLLEADPVATGRAQAARGAGSPEACGCLHCRNLVAVRHGAYPQEITELLDRLGIPVDRESEVHHFGELESGLHLYGGWFHFVGRLMDGPECHAVEPEGGAMQLTNLSDRFLIGFTQRTALVPPSFPAGPVGQIEFTAMVPWVLEEPCP